MDDEPQSIYAVVFLSIQVGEYFYKGSIFDVDSFNIAVSRADESVLL